MWNMHQVDPTGLLPTPARCRRLAWLNRMLRSGLTLEEIEAKRWSKDSGEYSIYCLAENGKCVRYIGITNQSSEVRLRQHLADCGRGRNLYKENWIRSCISKGVQVSVLTIYTRAKPPELANAFGEARSGPPGSSRATLPQEAQCGACSS